MPGVKYSVLSAPWEMPVRRTAEGGLPQQVVDVASSLARLLPALSLYERAMVPNRENIHTRGR